MEGQGNNHIKNNTEETQMAKAGLDIIRDIGTGVTPIVVGFLLTGGIVALPVLGALNVWLGWGMVAVGILDLVQSFR